MTYRNIGVSLREPVPLCMYYILFKQTIHLKEELILKKGHAVLCTWTLFLMQIFSFSPLFSENLYTLVRRGSEIRQNICAWTISCGRPHAHYYKVRARTCTICVRVLILKKNANPLIMSFSKQMAGERGVYTVESNSYFI